MPRVGPRATDPLASSVAVPFDFPIMLDVTRRAIVIVGGGAVAARKAKALLAAGATNVTCVSPAFHDDMPEAVRRVPAEYASTHVTDAGLVFAATNSTAVNDAVVRDASARGIFVTRADVSDDEELEGDFTTPASHRDGSIGLAVSAGSPALAAAIRDELVGRLDDRWVRLAAAHAALRPALLKSRVSGDDRRKIFHALSTRAAMEANAVGGMEGLLQLLRQEFPNLSLDWIVLPLTP